MRAKVAIPLLLMGIFALLLPFITRPKLPMADVQTTQAAVAIGQPTPQTTFIHQVEISSHRLPAPAGETVMESNTVTDDSATEENENYVENRMNELENLGMTDDPGSLVTIESEFDSREPRIQKAAVAAAIQFGSRDAIPALQEAYLRFDDPGQKLDIKKAIDFLELPSMAEVNKAIVPPPN